MVSAHCMLLGSTSYETSFWAGIAEKKWGSPLKVCVTTWYQHRTIFWPFLCNRPIHQPVSPSPPELCRHISELCHCVIGSSPPTWDIRHKLIGCSIVTKEWRRFATMYEALWELVHWRPTIVLFSFYTLRKRRFFFLSFSSPFTGFRLCLTSRVSSKNFPRQAATPTPCANLRNYWQRHIQEKSWEATHAG